MQLGLSDESAVRRAYLANAGSLDEAHPQVALQRMVQTGVELVVGVAHDPLFGSLVMVGLCGLHTDLLGDRSFRSLPLTDRDAAAMWRELRAAPLLTGYRGTPAMDTDALERLLLRVAQLADDFSEVSELDLNPVSRPLGELRLWMSSSSCSLPRMNPTPTRGVWLFDVRIGRTHDCSVLVRMAPVIQLDRRLQQPYHSHTGDNSYRRRHTKPGDTIYQDQITSG